MKIKSFLTVLALSVLTVSVVTSCGDEDLNPKNETGTPPSTKDDVVTVDAYGNVSGGHRFTQIDDTNFYIDDILYTASQGDLYVSGYDKAYFKGAANIVKTLKYDGRSMNVLSIGTSAFNGCTGLTSVNIPSSVESINDQAFNGCTGLTSVTIPNSVTYIGESAFSGTGIKSITIPSSVVAVGNYAFYSYDLTTVTINSNSFVALNAIVDFSMSSIFGLWVKKIHFR